MARKLVFPRQTSLSDNTLAYLLLPTTTDSLKGGFHRLNLFIQIFVHILFEHLIPAYTFQRHNPLEPYG